MRSYKRQYIYDVAQRVLHWWIALSTLALIATGLVASYQEPGSGRSFTFAIHMGAGKFLFIAFTGRILWGVIGPGHARFQSFFHPSAWMRSLKTRKIGSADGDFGHHAQASISYLGFYALISTMIVTGFLLAAMLHGEGPFADRFLDRLANVEIIRLVHEYGWWAIAFFVITHIGALIFHEWHDKIPIAQSMISGFQYRTVKEKNKDAHK